jgi:RecB family exonuclease
VGTAGDHSMTDELVLSSSSVSTYLRCGYRYYLAEVLRLPAAGSVAMALGTALHAGVERLLKNDPRRPVDALYEAYAREVDKITDPEEDPATALPDAVKMLDVYTTQVWPGEKPVAVEEKFVMRIAGVLWSGIFDRRDKDTVRDLKSTAGKTINGNKPKFDLGNHQLQMDGYRFGFKSITGRWPRQLLLDVITRTGKYRQYEITPQPATFLDTLGIVRDAIMQRSYEPTGTLNGSCSYCPYRRTCEYSNAEV